MRLLQFSYSRSCYIGIFVHKKNHVDPTKHQNSCISGYFCDFLVTGEYIQENLFSSLTRYLKGIYFSITPNTKIHNSMLRKMFRLINSLLYSSAFVKDSNWRPPWRSWCMQVLSGRFQVRFYHRQVLNFVIPMGVPSQWDNIIGDIATYHQVKSKSSNNF